MIHEIRWTFVLNFLNKNNVHVSNGGHKNKLNLDWFLCHLLQELFYNIGHPILMLRRLTCFDMDQINRYIGMFDILAYIS